MMEYRCDATRPLPKKMYLDLQKENGRAVSIIKSYYLNKRDISIRQHFQDRCDLKSVSSEMFISKLLVLRCVRPYSNISKKCLLRL